MFTGLVESVGAIARVEPLATGFRLEVRTDLGQALAPGDSVAVNGVCLTVVSLERGAFQADISPETARVTTLGALRPGTRVNLERPLKADARLGGHFVQGHVDAVGTLTGLRHDGECHWITVSYPAALAAYIVHKGSIAVDGISLTVAVLDGLSFDVQIVPFTWEHTNLKGSAERDAVNIECDILGKYVARAAEVAGWRKD